VGDLMNGTILNTKDGKFFYLHLEPRRDHLLFLRKEGGVNRVAKTGGLFQRFWESPGNGFTAGGSPFRGGPKGSKGVRSSGGGAGGGNSRKEMRNLFT